MRLHIIGLPSAGKTTLGEALSLRLSVPHYDLDDLAFVDEQWTMRPVSNRDEMLERILEEPGFVTEGGFIGWTQPLFDAVDYILWLDPPIRTLVWRHVRRHGRRPWRLVNHLRFQMLMYARPAGAGPARFDPDLTRAGIKTALRPWAHKVYRVRRTVSPDDAIDRLASS